MTNLVSVVVALSTATNWTGVVVQERELGVVLTNHTAVVEYRGKRTEVVLLTELGEVAVWREPLVFKDSGETNFIQWVHPLYISTNLWATNLNLNVTNWIGL